jgi:membrane protein YqaA with SNARE-associated domain
MKNLFKNLHSCCLKWAGTKWGAWALFMCAFADASCLPLPTPMLFLTLALLQLTKAYKYALFGTIGTLCGALAGYCIGYFAWLNVNGDYTGLAQFMFNHIPGFSEAVYSKVHLLYAKWGFGILFVAAFVPLPYKLFSISSGVFDVNLLVFSIATVVGQGIKFYSLAWLTLTIGTAVKKLIETRMKTFGMIGLACIALVIVIINIL